MVVVEMDANGVQATWTYHVEARMAGECTMPASVQAFLFAAPISLFVARTAPTRPWQGAFRAGEHHCHDDRSFDRPVPAAAMRLTPAGLRVQPAPPAAPTPTRRPPPSRSAQGQRGASLLLRPIQLVDAHPGQHEGEGLVHPW